MLYRKQIFSALLLILASACRPPAPGDESGRPSAAPKSDALGQEPIAQPEYNLGDVDFGTISTLTIAKRSKVPPVQVEEKELSLRRFIALANATVSQPYPKELWIDSTLDSGTPFRLKDSVLVRLAVVSDQHSEPLASKNYVFSGRQLVDKPVSFEFDLMPLLNPVPKSILLENKLEIVWFPDTDPATIDPTTVDISKGQRLERQGNPLRITFK